MKKSFINNPFFRLISPVVSGVLIYLLILLINNNVKQLDTLFSTQEVYVCVALSLISLETVRLGVIIHSRYFKGSVIGVNMIISQVLLTSVISMALVLVCLYMYYDYIIGYTISRTELKIFTILFSVLSILYNVLHLSNQYLQKENTVKLNVEKQQKELLDMEMSNFKNDINPDLLYESLENLISLMYRDIEKAEDYIDCLASSYRYILTHRTEELVPLEEEVAAGKNMIKLLNERYYGIITLNINFGNNGDEMLIPGSLPLILETIIRNSIVSRFEPFTIICSIEDDYITVQSKLNDKLNLHPASEYAFTKLQRSYTRFTDLPLIKVKAYQENYIKLPIIKIAEELI
jgi:sensor histidine kinase YesM